MTQTELQQLFERYGGAWASHDPEAILALHADDTALSVAGLGQEVRGKSACREAIGALFAIWPDLAFELRRLHLSPEIIVFESVASATQQTRLELADGPVEPIGQRVSWQLCDVIRLRDGLVVRKDAYCDFAGYRSQMRAGREPRSPGA